MMMKEKVDHGTARNTEEPQGTPLMQSYVSNVYIVATFQEFHMMLLVPVFKFVH